MLSRTDPRALGVFDSGLGGLTVARAILEELPHERVVYLGDTARVPYGSRSPETVLKYARGCARALMEREVKALVVACNTVSAVALDMLRVELDVPVIGVIEPGARAAVAAMAALESSGAASASETSGGGEVSAPALPGRIAVIGTTGTIRSGAYPRAVSQVSTRHEVVSRAAPLLVPLVEEGWLEGEVPRLAVERYLKDLIPAGARVLVLGCTHYPLLAEVISEVLQRLSREPVTIVDSARATAQALRQLFADEKILPGAAQTRVSRLELLVTDLPQGFQESAGRFLGQHVGEVQQIDLAPG